MRRAEGVCGTRRRVPRNRPSKAVHIVTSRTAPSLLIVCALAMASPDRPFAAEATMATPPGLEVAGLERSELLLGQLGCASCHSAGAGEDRIFPRRGPVLGDVGARATRRYLEELIADPQSVKPGSPMPALFRSLDEDERQRTVSRIADFLLSRANASLDRIEGDLEEIELGRRLYHSVGCVACHGPQETREALARPFELGATAASPEPVSGTVTLAGLARRISVPRLTEFLIDPSHIRPSGRMPALRLGDREARAIAVYLLREQFEAALATNAPAARAQGLRYRYFERGFSRVIEEIDGAKPKGQGIAPKFTIDLPRRNDRFGFEFSGLLRIERSGTYRFYLRSDDGSGLWIGDRLLINNDGDHAPTEKSETIDLEAGEHPIRVAYYENGGGEELRVQWEGPGVAREDIPSTALFHLAVPMVPLDLLASNAKSDGDDASSSAASETRAIDPLRVEEGAQHFSTLGCRSCHALEPGDRLAPPQAKPLADLDPDAEGGCLDSKPRRGVPGYALAPSLARAVRDALAEFQARKTPLTESERVERTLAAYNCYACHERGGRGGPSGDLRVWFQSTHGETMGIEGSVPPPLDGVGRKLKREWLEEVLVRGGSVRPYMLTRMPQFGAANVGFLAQAFEKVDDARPSSETEGDSSVLLVRAGQRLLGTQGMACITCHQFNGYESLGIPSLDLATTTRRVKKAWFRDYLLDPQEWRPGTRMPQFFSDGESARPDILDGDAALQIEAMWAHLERGSKAPLPHGLQTAGMELVPREHPIIYRHWVRGIGSRAIAVGYPERLNLAFDAARVRLGLIWQEGFLDVERHRVSRGDGEIAPLGTAVVEWPSGPEFAVLESDGDPWPAATGKAGGFEFRGYELDKARRPAFLYEIGDTAVSDRFVDSGNDLFPFFQRTIVLRSDNPPGRLYFRAGRGRTITEESGRYLIDGTIELRFAALPNESQPALRKLDDAVEILVPIRFTSGEARIVEEIRW